MADADDCGVCAAGAPALITRDGRLVFTGSGRTLDEVVAALRRTTLAELVLFGGPTETHPLFTLSH